MKTHVLSRRIKQHITKTSILIAIALAVVVSTCIVFTYPLIFKSRDTAFVITLSVFSKDGRLLFGPGVTSSGRELYFCVQVIAIKPPQAKGSPFKTIYYRCSSSPVVEVPRSRILDIAKGWVEDYRKRGVDPSTFYTSVSISAWVVEKVNETTFRILAHDIEYVPYSPYRILRGEIVRKDFRLVVDPQHVKTIKIVRSIKGGLTVGLGSSNARLKIMDEDEGVPKDISQCWSSPHGFVCILYDLKWWVGPENMSSVLPRDYFRPKGDRKYYFMKTPILIVYNSLRDSGNLVVSISIDVRSERVVVYASIGIGDDVISEIRKGHWPELTIKLGGISWGGETYRYYAGGYVRPESWWWAYIWARPIFAYYKQYICHSLGCEETKTDRFDALIIDAMIVRRFGDYYIDGYSEYGKPHEKILEYLFKGAKLRYYGCLGSHEAISLRSLIKYYNKCGVDFEVGIPVGAILGAIIGEAIGGPYGATIGAAIGSVFSASLSVQGSEMTVNGGIDNKGPYGELIYVALSNLTYVKKEWWFFWVKECKYNVPLGIFIEAS